MTDQQVIPVLENLLSEIDAVIARLNTEGADLFSEGQYDRARALLNKVESITGYRGKVLCLVDEWKALNVPATKKPSAQGKKPGERSPSKPLPKGLKTSYDEFRYPILEALVRLGGSAKLREVLRIVEEILSDELNIYDYQPLPSDPNSVRWKNTAHWERYNLVQDGLLASDSRRGVWEITDAGREALKHAKDNPDLQRKLFGNKNS
jgi:hypothetical protein